MGREIRERLFMSFFGGLTMTDRFMSTLSLIIICYVFLYIKNFGFALLGLSW